MAGPPTAAFAELSWHFAGDAYPSGAVSTLGVEGTMDPPEGWEGAMLAFFDELAPNMTSSTLLTEVRAKVGPVATGPTYSWGQSLPGEASAETSPPNTCYLFRKGVAGVSNRLSGRMFWPGCSDQSVQNGGLLATGTVTALQSNLSAAFNALLSAGLTPVVFSTLSSDPRTITSITPAPRVATQRRRLRR